MKILVDTCIWSQALRRKSPQDDKCVQELKDLIQEVRVQMIGPVRQELLSGIKSEKQFDLLRDHLAVFPDLEIETKDFELAADYYNLARKNGVQGSNTDFLICAISKRRDMPIFTADKDFVHFKTFLPIAFHTPRI